MNEQKQDWMTTKWRPMMAVVYMAINICDFILFPILFTIVQFWETSASNDAFRQWAPMTLQGGGLIHMAFGAILGVAAWTRGKEKEALINNGVNPNTQESVAKEPTDEPVEPTVQPTKRAAPTRRIV